MGKELNVISTEMDFDLFTNKKYYRKFRKAIKKASENYDLTDYSVACYEDYIVLFDQQKHIVTIVEF